MRIRYAVFLSVVLLLVSASAQKVNDPADVQAIKDTQPVDDIAANTGNAEAVATSFYSADATRMEPNQPALVGTWEGTWNATSLGRGITLNTIDHGAGGLDGLEAKEECYNPGDADRLFTARVQGAGLK
jgi:hypothetical protein